MEQKILGGFINLFEGKQITTIVYRGKLCWIACEIGGILDYAWEGRKLAVRIFGEWCNEFMLNEHYAILKGIELAEFKQFLKTITESVVVSSPQKDFHLMLIYEPGLHLVFTKTNKPVGLRLREFMATKILPPNSRIIGPG